MNEPEKILEDWYRDIRIQASAHKLATANCHKANRRLGIPVVALSAIVGSSAFTVLQQSGHANVKIGIGVLSICAAVLAGLQTFLKYSELAERHKSAGVKFGELSRELQQILGGLSSPEEETENLLNNFRTRWDALEEQSPPLSGKVLERASAIV